MERNSVFHPLHLVIFVVECDAAFVKEIDTKNVVVTKICGINNNCMVFIKNNILIEFREPDFFNSHKCRGCSCSCKQKDL